MATAVASCARHVLGEGGHPSSLLLWNIPFLPNTCPYLASLLHGEGMTPTTKARSPCQHLLGQKAVVTVLSTRTIPFPSAPLTHRKGHPQSLFPLTSGSSSTKGQHLHVHGAAGKRLFIQKCVPAEEGLTAVALDTAFVWDAITACSQKIALN